MSEWRVIITDTESLTGVAPVCDSPDHAVHAQRGGADAGETLPEWVFDCCPHPHIETWNEDAARWAAEAFTRYDAEACS